ncbi:MAG: DUF3806 domain-containing protein, partial [Propionibacteriaceae bacterium]|nr:DUF3806 domain-containing protein [Propionibacteriaceae bacterium]
MTTLIPLNEAEAAWLAGLSKSLSDRGIQDLAALSAFFATQKEAWLALPADERPDPNPLINSVGAAVGDHLVAELGMEWMVASDEHGVEAAVVGQPGDVLVYPMNAVAKRWTGES